MILNEELIQEYNDVEFTFKQLYKDCVTYEKKYKNKTVTVRGEKDYRCDLNLHETLNSLQCELEDITIEINKR